MNLREMRQQSKMLHQQLTQKNDYRMTDIIQYLRGKDLTARQVEMLRLTLLQKALQAQKQGRAVDSVFDFDYKKHIDDLVENLPPAAEEEQRRENIRLWTGLVFALTGLSVSYDLVVGVLLGQGPAAWSVTYLELLLVLAITGLAFALGRLAQTHKLEKDPDFFSKKGKNPLADFLRAYGFSLLWILVLVILMYLTRGRVLFQTSFAAAALVLMTELAAFFLLPKLARSK